MINMCDVLDRVEARGIARGISIGEARSKEIISQQAAEVARQAAENARQAEEIASLKAQLAAAKQ